MSMPADRVEAAEAEIRERQKEVSYQIREYPIEVLVDRHTQKQKEGKNELFVPDYQRDLVWEDRRQSLFIESLLIGLPIPYLFVADAGGDSEELAGRLEIIDGTQRIRTLARFVGNELVLEGLEKLPSLVGFKFNDLSPSRQRRFLRITLRLIELTEQADEETRLDMFNRINTGSVKLNPMETRRGSKKGPFLDLVTELSKDARFINLAPVSKARARRFEREELVTRFFAFADDYEKFGTTEAGKVVADFIDEYVDRENNLLADKKMGAREAARLRGQWDKMLAFVKQRFPNGFAKAANASSTPRVRFEAIAVGVTLALKAKADLEPKSIEHWLGGKEFKDIVTSDAANNKERVVGRIEFVRDSLLAS